MGGTDNPEGRWELSTFSVPPKGDTARPNGGSAERRQHRVLQAALSIVSSGGYERLSTRLIVSTSGVSRRGFNAWFSTAEEAFVAAHDQCMDQMIGAATSAIEEAEQPEDQLREGFRAVTEYLVADPARADAMLIEIYAAGYGALRRHEAAVERLVLEAEAVLERAGLDEPLARHLARFGIGALREAIRTRMVRGELHTLPDLVTELADAAFPLQTLGPRRDGRSSSSCAGAL